MNLSKERILSEAETTGFRREILEKVYVLIQVLEEINKDNFLKERLVLKGGTALNLFFFDLARLSVDADFNYIGSVDKKIMINERPEIFRRLERVCTGLGLSLYRKPVAHAGGKNDMALSKCLWKSRQC